MTTHDMQPEMADQTVRTIGPLRRNASNLRWKAPTPQAISRTPRRPEAPDRLDPPRPTESPAETGQPDRHRPVETGHASDQTPAAPFDAHAARRTPNLTRCCSPTAS